MKKITALLLALLLSISVFTACGGDEKPADSKGDAGVDTSTPAAQDSTYDVGEFTVTVPDGWLAVPVKDTFGADPNANKTDKIILYKGAKSEYDIFDKPTIDIVFYDEVEGVMPFKDLYENAADIEAFTAGEHNWTGFTGEAGGGNKLILLWDDAGDLEYQVTIWPYDDADVTIENETVKKIIGSIKPTKSAEVSTEASE